jgi:hypothetical protein
MLVQAAPGVMGGFPVDKQLAGSLASLEISDQPGFPLTPYL